MCGRYSVSLPPEAIRRLFQYRNRPNLKPRYNIAPTQSAPIVRAIRSEPETGRELVEIRWGLVPAWAKAVGDGPLLINARIETVAEKPSFRDAFRARRCLAPADGFYEWRRADNARQPFRIRPADGGPMGFAGIWERWRGPAGEELNSFAILTTEAKGAIREIHDRMPVMLHPDSYAAWLDPAMTDGPDVLAQLRLLDMEEIVAEPVSTHVNAVRNDDPHCFDPPEPAQQSLF